MAGCRRIIRRTGTCLATVAYAALPATTDHDEQLPQPFAYVLHLPLRRVSTPLEICLWLPGVITGIIGPIRMAALLGDVH